MCYINTNCYLPKLLALTCLYDKYGVSRRWLTETDVKHF